MYLIGVVGYNGKIQSRSRLVAMFLKKQEMLLIGSFNANFIKEYVINITLLQRPQRLVISGESYLKTTIPSMIFTDQTSGTQPRSCLRS